MEVGGMLTWAIFAVVSAALFLRIRHAVSPLISSMSLFFDTLIEVGILTPHAQAQGAVMEAEEQTLRLKNELDAAYQELGFYESHYSGVKRATDYYLSGGKQRKKHSERKSSTEDDLDLMMEDKKSESDSESDSEDFKSFTLPNPITPLKPPSRLGISRHDHKRRSIPNLATFDTSPKEMKKEGHKKKGDSVESLDSMTRSRTHHSSSAKSSSDTFNILAVRSSEPDVVAMQERRKGSASERRSHKIERRKEKEKEKGKGKGKEESLKGEPGTAQKESKEPQEKEKARRSEPTEDRIDEKPEDDKAKEEEKLRDAQKLKETEETEKDGDQSKERRPVTDTEEERFHRRPENAFPREARRDHRNSILENILLDDEVDLKEIRNRVKRKREKAEELKALTSSEKSSASSEGKKTVSSEVSPSKSPLANIAAMGHAQSSTEIPSLDKSGKLMEASEYRKLSLPPKVLSPASSDFPSPLRRIDDGSVALPNTDANSGSSENDMDEMVRRAASDRLLAGRRSSILLEKPPLRKEHTTLGMRIMPKTDQSPATPLRSPHTPHTTNVKISVFIATANAEDSEALRSMSERFAAQFVSVQSFSELYEPIAATVAAESDSSADRELDLIFLDLRLGMEEAMAFPEELRKRGLASRAKIVALTSQPSSSLRTRCFSAGMCECITLPFTRLGLDSLVLELRSSNRSDKQKRPRTKAGFAAFMKRRALANMAAGLTPAVQEKSPSASGSDAEVETPRSRRASAVDYVESQSSYENADEPIAEAYEESGEDGSGTVTAPEADTEAEAEADKDADKEASSSLSSEEEDVEEEEEEDEEEETLIERHERLQELFDCFVPPEYQELISPSGIEQLRLGEAVCRSLTIMFTDIRDFATMSEKMYIDELLDFLHAYFAFALPPIDQNGGFVDKFIGDAVMAVFAQHDLHEQARSAVKAAIGMLHNLELMTAYGFPISNTGIGINTGRTIVGLLGTETRLEPTSIGDAVNLAARTEAACKQYGAKLIITEYTLEKLGSDQDSYRIRELDHVAVKGKEKACRLYEVLDGEPDEGVRAMKTALLDSGDWPRALALYAEGNFEEALLAFESCLNRYPADVASALFVDRCQQLIENNIDRSTWDGVYKLRSK